MLMDYLTLRWVLFKMQFAERFQKKKRVLGRSKREARVLHQYVFGNRPLICHYTGVRLTYDNVGFMYHPTQPDNVVYVNGENPIAMIQYISDVEDEE